MSLTDAAQEVDSIALNREVHNDLQPNVLKAAVQCERTCFLGRSRLNESRDKELRPNELAIKTFKRPSASNSLSRSNDGSLDLGRSGSLCRERPSDSRPTQIQDAVFKPKSLKQLSDAERPTLSRSSLSLSN